MIHILWELMIIVGVAYGFLNGKAEEISLETISAAKEAVSLAIVMLGVVAMWSGLMEVATKCGLMEGMTKLLGRPIHWLFPKVPKGSRAEQCILMNITANILGLGWAATPAGLEAMKELRKLQLEEAAREGKPEPDHASTEMCTFLIINISSLQLIPVNIIAYRSQYGSVNPVAIVGISLVVTCFSTLVGVVYAKVMAKRHACVV